MIGQPALARAPKPARASAARFVEVAGMTVGTVPMSALVQRRKNYQEMDPAAFAALEASFSKHGMRSFTVVVPGAVKGTWEVIDGHHRWQAAERAGLTDLPVVVLDKGAEGVDADIAMLAFNVRAAPVAETYADFLRELSLRTDVTDLALRTGLDTDFLAQLRTDLPASMTAESDDATADDAPTTSPDRSRGTPIVMLFPRTDAMLALVAQAQVVFACDTPVDAAIAAMQQAVDAAASRN